MGGLSIAPRVSTCLARPAPPKFGQNSRGRCAAERNHTYMCSPPRRKVLSNNLLPTWRPFQKTRTPAMQPRRQRDAMTSLRRLPVFWFTAWVCSWQAAHHHMPLPFLKVPFGSKIQNGSLLKIRQLVSNISSDQKY